MEFEIAASFQHLTLHPATMTTTLPQSKHQKLMSPTHTQPPASSSSPFDSLPDALVLKIIRMAVESHCPPHQDFLVDVVSKVSFRFMRLATDTSLWDLHVGITFGEDDEQRLKDVVYGFLNEGTNYLSFWNEKVPSTTIMSGIYIYAVAARCPNLMAWYINGMRMDSWPTLKIPWSSLEDLWLDGVKMRWNVFKNIDIHVNVPNLKVFGMKSCLPVPKRKPILLPDFRYSGRLQQLRVFQGSFSFPARDGRVTRFSLVPLPRDLKKLCVLHGATIVNFDRAAVEKHLRNCSIEMT